jgi:pilus assembly protein CpaB
MKNRRAILFLGLAALCGLATASVARKAAQKGPDGTPVVVAAAPSSLGQAMDLSKVQIAYLPQETIPQGAFSNPGSIAGRVLARSVVPGEVILESSLLPEGAQAGLAALLDEKSRAVSIQVDEFVGVAGFIQPGSKVDVLSTGNNGSGARTTETVLQNVKVLAVDTKLDSNDGTAAAARVVTLEVNSRQAASLTHAESQGKLKLALRNPKNDEDSRPVQMVLGTDVFDLRY